MSGASESTDLSLLGRLCLRPCDQGAWEAFFVRYTPVILGWCRHFGLAHADCEDVTQEVLLRVARAMPDFEYDPNGTLRGWLRTITTHACLSYLEARRRRPEAAGGDQVADLLNNQATRDELGRRIEEEHARDLVGRARERVRLAVRPADWEAYRLTQEEGLAAAEAARRLGLARARVYKACYRVKQLLHEELRRLDRMPPRDPSAEGEP
jgi:RNA polymerase sigma-70 factor (ECF subfamily)